MRTTTTGIVPVNKEEIKELLVETKETLADAATLKPIKNKIFGAIDLWNLQKKHKTLGSSAKW